MDAILACYEKTPKVPKAKVMAEYHQLPKKKEYTSKAPKVYLGSLRGDWFFSLLDESSVGS